MIAREIAARLTAAEIALLLRWPKGLFLDPARRRLVSDGLIIGLDVTPLGLEVRAIVDSAGDE